MTFHPAPTARAGPQAGWRRVFRTALSACVLATLALPVARAQEGAGAMLLWRDQFPLAATAPPQALGATPAEIRDGRWRLPATDSLLVGSPDPEVSAVFRLEPVAGETPAEVPGLRLRVIVLPTDGALRYRYRQDGMVLTPEGSAPQRIFRVGEQGLLTALAGGAGRVTQVVLQDDGDAEIHAYQADGRLVLMVIPPTEGGDPSGVRPYYLGAPLQFLEPGLLVSGYTDNVVGALWLFGRFVGRANLLFSDTESVTLLRAGVAAQAWRTHAWSLWAEGGAAYLRVEQSGVATETVRATGGLTLHWRNGAWGAALHAGVMGVADTTVLTLQGGWQAWDWLGLLLSWQQLEGRSGYGLGAALAF